MDKLSLKLLKKLYKQNILSRDEINRITMFTSGEHYLNPNEHVLYQNGFAEEVVVGQDPDGYPIGDGSIRITLPGKSYIESLRKEAFNNNYPKAISTLALLVSAVSLIISLYK